MKLFLKPFFWPSLIIHSVWRRRSRTLPKVLFQGLWCHPRWLSSPRASSVHFLCPSSRFCHFLFSCFAASTLEISHSIGPVLLWRRRKRSLFEARLRNIHLVWLVGTVCFLHLESLSHSHSLIQPVPISVLHFFSESFSSCTHFPSCLRNTSVSTVRQPGRSGRSHSHTPSERQR